MSRNLSYGGWTSLVYNGVDRPTDRFSTTTVDDEFVKIQFENGNEVDLNSLILEADSTPVYFIISSRSDENQDFSDRYVFYVEAYERIVVNSVEISGVKLLVPSGTKYFIQGLRY